MTKFIIYSILHLVFLSNHSESKTNNSLVNNLKTAVQEARLLPDAEGIGGKFTSFSHSISIDSNYALVGALNDAAVVYKIENNKWEEDAILKAFDTTEYSSFGFSVSIDDGRALVGAPYDDNVGSVYVFEKVGSDWVQSAKLIQNDAHNFDLYGRSVSLYGNRAIVGSDINRGTVYVYDYDGVNWNETFELRPSDQQSSSDLFGSSLSLFENRIVVGNRRDGDIASSSGAAYIFEYVNETWVEVVKLKASDARSAASFGESVSLLADRVLIGSPGYSDFNNQIFQHGAAYIFEFENGVWIQKERFFASEIGASDNFGVSVSLTNDRALIGTNIYNPNLEVNLGAAYVFDKINGVWRETTKLQPENVSSFIKYGSSVAVGGDFAFVGAPESNENGENSGTLFVHKSNNNQWNQYDQFDLNGNINDLFGYSVSLSDNKALVGAPSVDDNGLNSGAVYFFDLINNEWVLNRKIVPSDNQAGDFFGSSVSLHNNRAIVGSHLDDDNGEDSGSAYIFEFINGQWVETDKLTPNDVSATDEFGFSVSMMTDRVIVGSYLNTESGSGAAYIYENLNGSWVQTAKLIPSDGQQFDRFGYAVDIEGDRAVVGSIYNNSNSNDGAVYVYRLINDSWSEVFKLIDQNAIANQFGTALSISGDHMIVGSSNKRVVAFNFVNNLWVQGSYLSPNGLDVGIDYGTSLGMFEDYAVVGGRFFSTSGAAFLFDFINDDWIYSQKLVSNGQSIYAQYGNSVSVNNGKALIGSIGDVNELGISSGASYVLNLTDGYSVSVDVSGLINDEELVLENNGSYALSIESDGFYTFEMGLFNNDIYSVTILKKPSDPLLKCVVVDGDGTISSADVDDVRVECELLPDLIYRNGFEK